MEPRTQLESALRLERERGDQVWLTQPMGGGRVETLTFGRALGEARRVATHLLGLGLPPGSAIGLFAKNNAWWPIADLAIWLAGHVSVPLYPLLAAGTVRQVLDHAGVRLLLVGKLDDFASMEPGIPPGLPRIALPLAPSMKAPAWADLVARTEPLRDAPARQPGELASILYTSGSTGLPKGVMHSFATMTASGRGFAELLDTSAADRMISYLPLAHGLERTLTETMSLLTGLQLYFAERPETFLADVQRARPTLFVSVPRLWQRLQAGVFEKVPRRRLEFLLRLPLVGALVRRSVLTRLGLGHVRFAGSGSAPLPPELAAWYAGLGLRFCMGYGMTENFGYSHALLPEEGGFVTVGRPQRGCDHRLGPDGEVQVRSPATMLGYHRDPALTAEVLGPDGWLRTGDLGSIDAAGRLVLTGRCKDPFKTSKGKYVAPAPIEGLLLRHPAVEAACVVGAAMPQPCALLALAPEARAAAGADRSRLGAELLAHLEVVNEQLDPHERLEFLAVLEDEWTIASGLLTPTLKVQRGNVERRYAGRLSEWYAARRPVVWG